jgi:hypothetical protein
MNVLVVLHETYGAGFFQAIFGVHMARIGWRVPAHKPAEVSAALLSSVMNVPSALYKM